MTLRREAHHLDCHRASCFGRHVLGLRAGAQGGFTVVEVLITGVVFVIILGALTGLFVSSSRAYRVNERVSDRQQNTQTTIALLQGEIALAGYRGTCSDAGSLLFTEAAPSFEVERGPDPEVGPDRIRIRYYDDRYSGQACGSLRTVEFTVGPDEDGSSALLMSFDELAVPTPVVQDVVGLVLYGYFKEGDEGFTDEKPEAGFRAVSLQVTFSDGTFIRFVVGLKNPQSFAREVRYVPNG